MTQESKQKQGYFPQPRYEFHIERNLRSKYQIDEVFFSQQGSVIFTDFSAVRLFVHKLNARRHPRLHVYPGEVNAAGLIEEIFHYVLRQYESHINPRVFSKASNYLEKNLGAGVLDQILYDFLVKFPCSEVYTGKTAAGAYLQGFTGQHAHKHMVLEEAMMLFFANFNPANTKLKELFDVSHLKDPELFRQMMDQLEDFFETQPPFGPDNQDIFDLFKTPILSHPHDISKQLDYIMERWQSFIPEHIYTQLLRSKDLLKEDVRFDTTAGGDTPTAVPQYKGMAKDADGMTIGKSGYRYAEEADGNYEEPEAFTTDVHWMPNVVMLAKNTYVWLDQLSKKYQRDIRTLDQIPDEELDMIKSWNFSGLWLIGIWERSEASRRIKHIMGNVDAVSSAYSLYDYQIAHDLGGEQAYHNLNERTRARGIRLASDMVPNHTGIYSKWVAEHPDYFIQAPTPPFPAYSFQGENLSQHPDLDIRIEDGYYSKTDAAVVFQWKNIKTGELRYIYHGNDGTVMPWNDTAQLDMLKQQVREAVIEKIFEVARKFSIIRFDAAMTLAKKHFSRLWYPRPGTGGDIPSRSDYAMTKKQFDQLFPVEFWREVVDRINREMPETLLLAEAFWFMEGYFVRTLGMHRVYNSAFMHMLKNEENEKYRDLITNTLEFEPEILKRYVNFMSNPDEETAIRQFGTDDKYFGVCLLMNTLPGLPMFAHGQIEGYTEKYGMEYQRAYYNEEPAPWLIEKHEKQIFPVTQKRYLFSEIDHFNIFDFIDGYGNINENVFAYTNRFGNEKALVLYNNKYEQAEGRIHFSAPKLTKTGADKESVSISLAQAMDVEGNDHVFYLYTEHISGLEYIKRGSDIMHSGWQMALQGFEYRLFWNFRKVYDPSGEYEKLYWKIGGQGVKSIESVKEEMRLQPLHEAFTSLFSEDIINFLINAAHSFGKSKTEKLGYMLLKSRFEEFVNKTRQHYPEQAPEAEKTAEAFIRRVKAMENTFDYLFREEKSWKNFLASHGIASINELLVIASQTTYRENMNLMLAYYAMKTLETETPKDSQTPLWQKMQLSIPLKTILAKTGRGEDAVQKDIGLLNILLQYGDTLFDFTELMEKEEDAGSTEKAPVASGRKTVFSQKSKQALTMLDDPGVRSFLGVNTYQNITYFSKESYQELTEWLFSTSVLNYFDQKQEPQMADYKKRQEKLLHESIRFYMKAKGFSEKSNYELERLRKEIGD